MKCLVTGVAGFVGSHLAERLVRQGNSVVGVDAFTDYYDARIKRENIRWLAEQENFELVTADLNELDLAGLVHDVEVVFHQAGQPGVRKSWGVEFGEYTSQNIRATQALLEAAKNDAPALRKFVYASSSSVYGNADRFPALESSLPKPFSPYGVTKLAAEHLCSLYAENFDVPTVSLRYFTVYGPRQRPDMAFTKFCLAALRGEGIPVFGSGDQIRDFTFVGDVVEANLLAAQSQGVTPGEVFNISGGVSVSVNDVLAVLQELHGADLSVQTSPGLPGDVWQTGGSSAKAEKQLGWLSVTSLEEGLASQYEWAVSVLDRER